MSRNLVVTVVVTLLLIVAGWYLTRPKQTAPQPQPSQTPASTESAAPSASSAAMMKQETNTVKITATGFSPKQINVKVGDTVTWENEDSVNHTVNSAPHPTHTLYPILNKVGLIKPGEKKSLQFTTAGNYTYHDHLNPSLTGSVTVQ